MSHYLILVRPRIYRVIPRMKVADLEPALYLSSHCELKRQKDNNCY